PEFSFSPDGYSKETLKALGKIITVADIHRVFNIARETPGIRIAFNFFWNPPKQTFLTWLKMLVFTAKCKILLRKKAGGIIFGNARIEPHTPLQQLAIDDGMIEAGTDFLPETTAALRKTFYSNRSTRYLDVFYMMYSVLWKLKQKFKQ
ncbi:hypothetical protein K8T06_17260, partial [bacterium]|nr:hypothetical protein [bacterium]